MGYITTIKKTAYSLLPANIVIRKGNTRNTLYLTFDDGPHPDLTIPLLEILERQDIRATFFFSGETLNKYPEHGIEVCKKGHEIGNHAYSHKKDCLTSVSSIIDEFEKTQTTIQNVFGLRNKIFRPPYGILNPAMILFSIKTGIPIVLWSLDSRDGFLKDPVKIQHNLKSIKGGDIILFHEDCPATIMMLEEWIYDLKRSGYRFGVISEAL